ncbi:spore germination protein GerW family protein [Pseudonocardia asaccharolytica]|uniref:Sporulation protein n=1 Tax=Pseudonocardia asaccharolytica DSM 44247 = NBRC 16224 TaxID=1123024 RepID=A0A511D001_9PSEU|nr:spore germination protein GerW family protein [Pseudonocardia asaccharolytica]GEL18119.1 hypothetical protein PA7_19560 [Pseudonocardia asaccharolytica DSM 44247 = NBRC 16224]
MDVSTAMQRVEDAIRVNRVYGEPVTADEVTIIPAARVGGGAGGGGGRDAKQGGEGSGGGIGWGGRPSGAFVVREGTVRWEPAVDVNRLIAAVATVAVTALLTARTIAKAQARANR